MTEIDNLLYRLGATANYTGFRYISCALHLCIQQPERLLLVTKRLYPDIGKRYGIFQPDCQDQVERIIAAGGNGRRHLAGEPPSAGIAGSQALAPEAPSRTAAGYPHVCPALTTRHLSAACKSGSAETLFL